MAKTYNLYLSRAWFDSDHYARFTELLNKRPFFTYNVLALPREDPAFASADDEQLVETTRRNMAGAHILFFKADVYDGYEKWIDVELDLAKNGLTSPKPVVGVKPSPSSEVAEVIGGAADRIVEWDIKATYDALKDLATYDVLKKLS